MKTLVVSPHPDDEVLGCGGTLLKRMENGGEIAWIIMTTMEGLNIWSDERIAKRKIEISLIQEKLNIKTKNLYELGYKATFLDQAPKREIIEKIQYIFSQFQPEEILVPHGSDIHSDHRVSFEAVTACTKRFRCPSVKKILCYEVMSETDQNINTKQDHFVANYYVDISNYLEEKINMLKIYENEIGEHPFPRSLQGIEALSIVRGAQMGKEHAEAFQLLRNYE